MRSAPDKAPQRGPSSLCWMTFVRTLAHNIGACEFFVTVTGSFRVLYVFVIMEVATRRLGQFNFTAHPTADCTLQFREVITGDEPYQFCIRGRDEICSSELNSAVKSMGLRLFNTPFRALQANAFCEGLAGSIRRVCSCFLIPIHERHRRRILLAEHRIDWLRTNPG